MAHNRGFRQAETNVVERSGGHFVQIGKSFKSWTLQIRRLHQNGYDVEEGREVSTSFFLSCRPIGQESWIEIERKKEIAQLGIRKNGMI